MKKGICRAGAVFVTFCLLIGSIPAAAAASSSGIDCTRLATSLSGIALVQQEAIVQRSLSPIDKVRIGASPILCFWELLEDPRSVQPHQELLRALEARDAGTEVAPLQPEKRASPSPEGRWRVFHALNEMLNDHGTFEWKVGERTIRVELVFDDRNDTLQVKLANHDDWMGLTYKGDRMYKNDPDYPDRDSFGQFVLDVYTMEDGSTALLIKNIQPGPLYYAVKKMRRDPYDLWRTGTLKLIRDWAHTNHMQVFAATPEAIRSRHGDLTDYETLKNYIEPFPTDEWDWQVVDFPPSGLGNPYGRHVWYSSQGNTAVEKTQSIGQELRVGHTVLQVATFLHQRLMRRGMTITPVSWILRKNIVHLPWPRTDHESA